MLRCIDPLAEAGRHRAQAAALRAAAPGVRRGTVSADIAAALIEAERLERLAVDQAVERLSEAAEALRVVAASVGDVQGALLGRMCRRLVETAREKETAG